MRQFQFERTAQRTSLAIARLLRVTRPARYRNSLKMFGYGAIRLTHGPRASEVATLRRGRALFTLETSTATEPEAIPPHTVSSSRFDTLEHKLSYKCPSSGLTTHARKACGSISFPIVDNRCIALSRSDPPHRAQYYPQLPCSHSGLTTLHGVPTATTCVMITIELTQSVLRACLTTQCVARTNSLFNTLGRVARHIVCADIAPNCADQTRSPRGRCGLPTQRN